MEDDCSVSKAILIRTSLEELPRAIYTLIYVDWYTRTVMTI